MLTPFRSLVPLRKRTATALLAAIMLSWIVPSNAVILNGFRAAPDPIGWSSSLLLRTGIGVCTATVVGPRVVLTAAHCLGQEKNVTINIAGTEYSLECEGHPDYEKNPSADFALCGLSADLATVPERVNADPRVVSRGARVIIAGYGCQAEGGVDATLGEFVPGSAVIVEAPKEASRNAYATTVGAAVCPGDGGGGTYLYLNSDPSKRILIGVNARSDVNVKSLIAITSTDVFLAWARNWSAPSDPSKPKRAICGLGGQEGCQPDLGGAVPETISREEVRIRVQTPTASLSLPEATSPNREERRDTALAARVMRIMTVPETTPLTLASQVCGEPQPDAYFDQFEVYNEASKTGIDRNTKFGTTPREIIMPVCAATSRIVIVHTSKNDRLSDYYQKYADRKSWTEFERSNGTSNPDLFSSYFVEVIAGLNPGLNIKNPGNLPTVFVPISPSSFRISKTEPAIGVSPQSISAVMGVPTTDAMKLACGGALRSDYSYDLEGVLQVLQTNRRLRKAKRWQPVNVLIADSGLDGAGINGVFESGAALLPDNIDFQKLLQLIKPQVSGDARSHGTQVASIILGGPLLARVQAATENHIRLIIRPIYHPVQIGQTSWVGPDTSWLGDVVDYAKTNAAQIVNMSLKTQTPMPSFLNEFGYLSGTLYVVAAGNLDGDISQKSVYPARYGGTGRPNLISVAATSETEEGVISVASFSNFGADYVDIGAPGCLVPALSYDSNRNIWRIDRVSGTSFATPLVSFAAAMIKSELGGTFLAALTKRRLLASADLHPDPNLSSKIEDGRTLNLVKALSVYEDVVETNSTEPLRFGYVKFKKDGNPVDTIDLSCSGKTPDAAPVPVSIPPNDVYKIRPSYNGQKAKVYYKGADGELFVSRECDLPPNLRAEITDESGNPLDSRLVGEFRDIVLQNSAKVQ
jgi:hypothetical protein